MNASAAPASSRRLSGARGIGVEVKVARIGKASAVPARGGDHGRVVGAERERCEARVRERGAQLGVGGDAADDRDRGPASLCCSNTKSLDERAHNRALVGRREVCAARLQTLAEIARRVQQRGLDAGEREVELADPRDRERERLGVALPCASRSRAAPPG